MSTPCGVAAFVRTLLNEVPRRGLKCDASLETRYFPYIRFYHISEDGVDNLKCIKRCEARHDLNSCLVPCPIKASVEAAYVARVVSPYVFMIAGMLLRFFKAG